MADEEEIEVIAEPEISEHPDSLLQQNPWFISQLFTFLTSLFANYGWFCLGFAVCGLVLWKHFQSTINDWLQRRQEAAQAAEYHKNPDPFIRRELAIETARRRMQERYDREAQEHAQKVLELEEERRLQQLNDREKKSCVVNVRGQATAASVSDNKPIKSTGKAKLRPEYNPMTDGGASCSWRSSKPRTGG